KIIYYNLSRYKNKKRTTQLKKLIDIGLSNCKSARRPVTMNWKKLLVPVLSSTLFLAACGGGTNSSESSNDATANNGKEVAVEFFSQKPEITRQLEDLAKSYNDQNENVKVTITTIGSGEGAAALQAKF